MTENTTAPQQAEATGSDVSGGERVLALFALAFAALIIGMAVDMLTGGKISGVVSLGRGESGSGHG